MTSSPAAVDPRVERTRAHVLAHAWDLIAEAGPEALNYRALADRARVTRQTLYRHWPTREQLLVDLLNAGPATDYPAESADARAVVTAFLRSLRDGMRNPALASTMGALIAGAEHRDVADRTLRAITVERAQELNRLLSPSGVAVDSEQFARLCGPVLFSRFIARCEPDDAFIDSVVDAWWATRPEAAPMPAKRTGARRGTR